MLLNVEPLLGQYAPITDAFLLREHTDPIISSFKTTLFA